MSFVFASPEYLASAASELANIGSTVGSANAAALGPTSSVLAAGADEVSANIAALFGAHAQAYQALSEQAAFFHQQFVELMSGGAAQYALTEAANASPLVGSGVMSGVTAPMQALAAAPASGNGVAGVLAAGSGAAPGAFGPGGSGASGQLVSSVGAGPAAEGAGAAAFGPGGAGYAGSLVSAGPVGSGGAAAAAGTVEEAAAVPELPPTPLAAVPATAPVAPAVAAARPATPAYSPATAAPAESPDE